MNTAKIAPAKNPPRSSGLMPKRMSDAGAIRLRGRASANRALGLITPRGFESRSLRQKNNNEINGLASHKNSLPHIRSRMREYRSRKDWFAALVFSGFLAACGGGGSSAPDPVTAPAAACVPLDVVHVQLFGDSIEAGSAAGISPAGLLQRVLDARFGAGTTLVESRAVPSTTSQQLVDGTDGTNSPWPASATADVVVIEHGVNDAYINMPLTQYKANLRAFASRPGAILQTPTAVHAEGRPATEPYAQAMREVAAEHGTPVADVAAYESSTFMPWQDFYLADGVHPNAAGTRLFAEGPLASAVGMLVAAMRCQ